MYACTRVLLLLALHVGLAVSFSWDVIVGADKRLEFYYNGTLTHAEDIPHDYISSIAYDPIQKRVLFTYRNYSNMSISILDLSTRKTQHLFTKKLTYMDFHLAYDPVTQLLFWCEAYNMYSLSLKSASFEKTVDGNLLRTLNHSCRDIAVDSCRGYIYWITDHVIERVRFDGSDREVLINSTVYLRTGLAIDQKSQKIYWGERSDIMKDGYDVNDEYADYIEQSSMESADLNGQNRRTLRKSFDVGKTTISSLAVSKDFIFWRYFGQLATWQIPKNSSDDVIPKLYSNLNSTCLRCHGLAANYTIKEQTQGTKGCEALKNLDRESNGFTGESCEVTICHNYCFNGHCSVSAEGRLTCRCKDGYSGDRCEVNACQEYCLNSGVCSLNEEDEPICQCTDDYEGKRCNVPVFLNTFIQNVSMWRDTQM